MSQFIKAPIPVSEAALVLNGKMAHIAAEILSRPELIPCDPEFLFLWNKWLDTYSIYQEKVLADADMIPSCRAGCSYCCMHWVEDVYSFESAILADHIRKTLSAEAIRGLKDALDRSESELVSLDAIMSEKLSGINPLLLAGIDRDDLLLAAFHNVGSPCPLLSADGSCSCYDQRPLTCRAYMSFSDPSFCRPGHDNNNDIPTYLLEPEENVSSLLDDLHAIHDTTGKTGLRSALRDLLAD